MEGQSTILAVKIDEMVSSSETTGSAQPEKRDRGRLEAREGTTGDEYGLQRPGDVMCTTCRFGHSGRWSGHKAEGLSRRSMEKPLGSRGRELTVYLEFVSNKGGDMERETELASSGGAL